MSEVAETLIEDERWDAVGLEDLAERAFVAVLEHLKLPVSGFCVSLLGCDDDRIGVLNADFRDKPTPTNVLSWPSEERGVSTPGATPELPTPGAPMPSELGDIAISYDTCEREAAAAGREMQDHVLHLLVHGMLHLLGYDHIFDEDGDLMEDLETQVLALLGVDDPYEGHGRV